MNTVRIAPGQYAVALFQRHFRLTTSRDGRATVEVSSAGEWRSDIVSADDRMAVVEEVAAFDTPLAKTP